MNSKISEYVRETLNYLQCFGDADALLSKFRLFVPQPILDDVGMDIPTSNSFSTDTARERPARPSIWPRLWRTSVMVLTYLVIEIAVKAVVVLQLVFLLCGAKPSQWLRRRGEELAMQLHGMWLYLSCAIPEAPWPFSPWPRATSEPNESSLPTDTDC